VSRYQPDEYDLERSHELERRLDRDEEREPGIYRTRKLRRRPRYFSGLMFRPTVASREVSTIELRSAS
jgi:hypothetical protein